MSEEISTNCEILMEEYRDDIIAGVITIPLYLEVFISQLIFASLSIWLSIRFINKESVIFRD